MKERDVVRAMLPMLFITKAQFQSPETAALRALLTATILEVEDLLMHFEWEGSSLTCREGCMRAAA